MWIAQTKLDALQREAEKRGMAHSRQGNLEHTARHGVSASEIEYLFYNDPMVSPDPYPENREPRTENREPRTSRRGGVPSATSR